MRVAMNERNKIKSLLNDPKIDLIDLNDDKKPTNRDQRPKNLAPKSLNFNDFSGDEDFHGFTSGGATVASKRNSHESPSEPKNGDTLSGNLEN